MVIRRWPVAAAAVVTMALAAGCGGPGGGTAGGSGVSAAPAAASASPRVSAPPAMPALSKQVAAALRSATSTHVFADVRRGSRHVVMDASMSRSGGLSGQLRINNVPLTFLVTRGSAYIKITAAFLRYTHLPSAACASVCGKWVKTSAGNASGITGGLGWSSLVSPSTHRLPRLSYQGPATVNGQPAWKLRSNRGSVAYVAAAGRPYPLRLTQGGNRIDFTRWNHAAIPPPPPPGQVVSPGRLGG
ncbi:MAG: hypothetical protein J2P32_04205 [Actinobacteria bacterium]|nr:hypothetical protein [Actinomycetota bacterium]